MSFIRTILGDIAPAQLGVCYAHEHVILDRSYTTDKNPEFNLDSVDKATQELNRFYADGGRAMVDSMPCDSGRSISKMIEVSQKTQVHLVVPTGLHLAKYYDSGHWGNLYSADELAGLFIADIETGIDVHDYNGPIVKRSSGKAGVLKCATNQQISAREQRLFAAVALAHKATGCPILTHTEQGTQALAQIDMFQRGGVNLQKVVLSHTDRKPDPTYHRHILDSGVNIEFDNAFRWKEGQGNPTLDLLVELLPQYPTQIMLGMDAARASYWTAYGGKPGLSFLLNEFSQHMRSRGITDQLIHGIFVTNPARTYTFDR